jgi:malic enzyme
VPDIFFPLILVFPLVGDYTATQPCPCLSYVIGENEELSKGLSESSHLCAFLSILQSNNAYIFPGFGLGVVTSGTIRVHDEMMLAAGKDLSFPPFCL